MAVLNSLVTQSTMVSSLQGLVSRINTTIQSAIQTHLQPPTPLATETTIASLAPALQVVPAIAKMYISSHSYWEDWDLHDQWQHAATSLHIRGALFSTPCNAPLASIAQMPSTLTPQLTLPPTHAFPGYFKRERGASHNSGSQNPILSKVITKI